MSLTYIDLFFNYEQASNGTVKLRLKDEERLKEYKDQRRRRRLLTRVDWNHSDSSVDPDCSDWSSTTSHGGKASQVDNDSAFIEAKVLELVTKMAYDKSGNLGDGSEWIYQTVPFMMKNQYEMHNETRDLYHETLERLLDEMNPIWSSCHSRDTNDNAWAEFMLPPLCELASSRSDLLNTASEWISNDCHKVMPLSTYQSCEYFGINPDNIPWIREQWDAIDPISDVDEPVTLQLHDLANRYYDDWPSSISDSPLESSGSSSDYDLRKVVDGPHNLLKAPPGLSITWPQELLHVSELRIQEESDKETYAQDFPPLPAMQVPESSPVLTSPSQPFNFATVVASSSFQSDKSAKTSPNESSYLALFATSTPNQSAESRKPLDNVSMSTPSQYVTSSSLQTPHVYISRSLSETPKNKILKRKCHRKRSEKPHLHKCKKLAFQFYVDMPSTSKVHEPNRTSSDILKSNLKMSGKRKGNASKKPFIVRRSPRGHMSAIAQKIIYREKTLKNPPFRLIDGVNVWTCRPPDTSELESNDISKNL